MKIIKRNGAEEAFNKQKIIAAITKANLATEGKPELIPEQIVAIAAIIENYGNEYPRALSVEEIQELVETLLMRHGAYETAKRYIRYRYTRGIVRTVNNSDDRILRLLKQGSGDPEAEKEADSSPVNSEQRDFVAGEVNRDLTERVLLPGDIVEAHRQGLIHFHDSAYFAQHMHNSSLINLKDMLQGGTVISGTRIETPHSFSTACNIATQIIAQVASNQYGGQAISLAHLAPFVEVSRSKLDRELEEEASLTGLTLTEEQRRAMVEHRLALEIKKGVQTLQYQTVTLMTTTGRSPYITFFLYLAEAETEAEKKDLALIIREVLEQRLEGVKNEAGVWVSPAFPKLIYVLEEDNVAPEAPYRSLTELAARCTAKRLTPDYISEKIMKQQKTDEQGRGYCYPCMERCSFLPFYKDSNGVPRFYGRFDQGVVTVNLPDAALTALDRLREEDFDNPKEAFFAVLAERLELCHQALLLRHKRLLGTLSDAAPILWQHGALARLPQGASIDSLLKNGYSTVSLGYAGLWECVLALTGSKLTEEAGMALAEEILTVMQEKVSSWREAENIGYVLYGTPSKATVNSFSKSLQKRFGIVEGVTDHNRITNAYHIPFTEPMDPFARLEAEARLQKLTSGGISCTRLPAMGSHPEEVMRILEYMYEHILYAGLRPEGDFCRVCGYEGELSVITDEDGKLIRECPHCGNRDAQRMDLAVNPFLFR